MIFKKVFLNGILSKVRPSLLAVLSLFTFALLVSSCEIEANVKSDPKFTIMFNPNADEYEGTMETITEKKNTSVTLPKNAFKRENFSFLDWNTEPDGSGKTYLNQAKIQLTENLTLYARWKDNRIKQYSVTFLPNAEDVEGTTPVLYAREGAFVTLFANSYTRAGYIFTGWNTESDGSGQAYSNGARFFLEENLTFYAQWKIIPENAYTAVFETGGGTLIESQIVVSGNPVIQPENPEKYGYTFGGWLRNEKEFDFSTILNKSYMGTDLQIVLKAKWNANLYTINFDSDGGTEVSSREALFNTFVEEPETPYKKGYIFKGWYYSEESDDSEEETVEIKFDFDSPLKKAGLTLKAKWEIEKYKVNFVLDGKIISTQIAEYDSLLTKPENPKIEGSTFKCWKNGDKEFDFNSKVQSNLTLVADFTVNTYTVTFDSNGGTDVPSQTVKHGYPVKKPDAPTLKGFDFTGWYYTENGEEIPFSFETGLTKSVALKAHWKNSTFKITFDSANEKRPTYQYVEYKSKITKPEDPRKEGHTFSGWFATKVEAGAETEVLFDFDTMVCESEMTLTAHWKANKYKVTFDPASADADEIDPQYIEYNTSPVEPEVPFRKGHTFAGWSRNGLPFNFKNDVIKEDTNLIARWNVNFYEVKFVVDGTEYASQKVEYNTNVTTVRLPEKENNIFECWNLKGKAYDFNSPVEKDLVLEAKWVDIPEGSYVVTFRTERNVLFEQTIVKGGEKVSAPSVEPRKNYTFDGWFKASSTTAFDFNDAITESFTLKQQWTLNEVGVVSVTLQSLSGDADLNLTINGNKITVKEGFETYVWTVEGEVVEGANTNELVMDSAKFGTGFKSVEVTVPGKYSQTASILVTN